MRVCKFPRSLTENDYQQILSLWLEVAGTKSKSRRIHHRLQNKKKNFQYLYIHFCLYSTCQRKNDDEDIVLIFSYFMHINPCIFSHFSEESYIFEDKVFLKIQKQCFKILLKKKQWEQSGFLPSPSCSSQHAHLFVSVTLCFAKMLTFLVRSRACCAVVNKLSTYLVLLNTVKREIFIFLLMNCYLFKSSKVIFSLHQSVYLL